MYRSYLSRYLILEYRGHGIGTPVLHQSSNTGKDKRNDEDMYFTVGAVKAKYSLSLSP